MSSISTCIQNVAVKLKAKTYSYQIGTTIFCDSTWHVEHPEKLHSVLISYVKHIKLPNRRVNQFYINQFYINQWTNFIFYKPILYKPMNQFYILSRIASAFCLYLSIYSQIFFWFSERLTIREVSCKQFQSPNVKHVENFLFKNLFGIYQAWPNLLYLWDA